MRSAIGLASMACALSAALLAPRAFAQDAGPSDAGVDASGGDPDMPTMHCPGGAIGCARAAIAYSRRVGSPVEFDVDTGWWPSGSPVQVRFQSALAGHTRIDAAGELESAWPEPMTLRADGTPGTGLLETDYGIVLDARVRLHLDVSGTMYDWEGSVPYVPMIDFRAMASTAFDPWAWEPVSVRGSTMRQHIADIPLSDAFISIPGIEGGLSFDAQADLASDYHSTQITFGGDADPITATADHTLAYFAAGPSVDYFPRLEGQLDQTITLRIYPSLYVSLLGRRWMVDLFELPVDIGPIAQNWIFDPSRAHLVLPDVERTNIVVDFGDVPVGTRATDGVPFDSVGDVDLWVRSPMAASGFAYPRVSATVAPHSTVTFPVEFAPTTEGFVEVRVPFQTNDPDTPAVYVTLRGNGIAAQIDADAAAVADAMANDASAGDPDDASRGGDASGDASLDGGTDAAMRGSCGCRVPGGAPSRSPIGVVIAMGVAAVVVRRRRPAM
jgi:MYXO-CTERM domain-containing protein